MSIHALLIMLGGVMLLTSTVRLVRARLLTIRYGIGWSVASLLAIVGAPLLEMLADHVREYGMTPTGFSLGVFIVCLGLICVQLSISVSGMQRVAQNLGEYSALLERRVMALEQQREGTEKQPDPEVEPAERER